jgi:hypothetical protein
VYNIILARVAVPYGFHCIGTDPNPAFPRSLDPDSVATNVAFSENNVKGSVQRESRRVWSNISTRYLVWGCGDGRSFIL